MTVVSVLLSPPLPRLQQYFFVQGLSKARGGIKKDDKRIFSVLVLCTHAALQQDILSATADPLRAKAPQGRAPCLSVRT